jgi:hypothetical protein
MMKYSWLGALLLVLGSTSAMAEIIILQGGGVSFRYGAPAAPAVGMPTILIAQPPYMNSPILHRAHAWSAYQKNTSGAGLVFQPYTGTESEAQLSLNKNMSRAHAFRLGN